MLRISIFDTFITIVSVIITMMMKDHTIWLLGITSRPHKCIHRPRLCICTTSHRLFKRFTFCIFSLGVKWDIFQRNFCHFLKKGKQARSKMPCDAGYAYDVRTACHCICIYVCILKCMYICICICWVSLHAICRGSAHNMGLIDCCWWVHKHRAPPDPGISPSICTQTCNHHHHHHHRHHHHKHIFDHI